MFSCHSYASLFFFAFPCCLLLPMSSNAHMYKCFDVRHDGVLSLHVLQDAMKSLTGATLHPMIDTAGQVIEPDFHSG